MEVAEEPSKASKDLLELEDRLSFLIAHYDLENRVHYRKYGFNELFENVFKSFEDCSDIIENPVPDDPSVDPWGISSLFSINS